MTTADQEALYQRAVALVLEHQKGSTSWLQRQLRVGYNSAYRQIERMEQEGLVGAPDHVGRREVLRPPSASLPGSSVVIEPDVPAWERRQGLFDTPSSDKPAGDDQGTVAEGIPSTGLELCAAEPLEGAPLVQVAVDLVGLLGLEGARRAVRAAADAAGESEAFRRPKAKSDHLTAIVERVEGLFAERETIAIEIADVLRFAKDIGLDPATIRKVIKDRAEDRDKRFTAEATYAVYRHSLGIEDPDFAIELPPPSVPPPIRARKLTAKEKAYQETLASVAASRVILLE